MATTRPLLPPGRTAVMGILNLTPDSFSDGGAHASLDTALAGARRMIAAGVDIIDLGGESTRPGADPVSEQAELDRALPVLRAIRAESDVAISIDTMKPGVARAAVAEGADIWNDVSALTGAGALQTAAALNVPVVLMHMQGEPRTMQHSPRYVDVVAEVRTFLLDRAEAAQKAGVARQNIWIDPGVGFGKTLAHNLALLAATSELASLHYPLLVGASRKRFIARLMEEAGGTGAAAGADAKDRLGGSLAVALHAASAGAAVVRVHDVAETVQALAVRRAIVEADE